MSGPGEIPVLTRINNRWELMLPAHRAARPQWITGWEVERLASMQQNIRPGDIVYDVGTEEGDLSGLYCSWGAQLVLIEPTAETWPNPKLVWDANNFSKPLAFFAGFLDEYDDGNGTVEYDWPASAYGLVIPDHGFSRPEERLEIGHRKLDTLVEATNIIPDVITMDVEGAELRVLNGAVQTLLNYHPLVYVSLHADFLQAHYGASEADVYNHMASLGYKDLDLGTDHEHHVLFHHPTGRVPVELDDGR